MILKGLSESIHLANKEKGFYDNPRTPPHIYMLIVTELSEAVAEYQNGTDEAESVELADALIRILDYAGFRGWDLDKIVEKKLQYNRTRPYLHGKAKN